MMAKKFVSKKKKQKTEKKKPKNPKTWANLQISQVAIDSNVCLISFFKD